MSSETLNVKDIILKAGAGAGKTTTLVASFLDFADQFYAVNKKFPRIVVTTFTRKATQELKERLLKKSLELKRDDLFNYVSSKSSVQISTIHGVLNIFLSRYGTFIGLTPDYKIIAENENQLIARKIIRNLILSDDKFQELIEEYDFNSLEEFLIKYFEQKILNPNLEMITSEQLEKLTRVKLQKFDLKMKDCATHILRQADKESWQQYAQEIMNTDWTDLISVSTFYEKMDKPVFSKKNPPFDESVHEELQENIKITKSLIDDFAYTEEFRNRHQKNSLVFKEIAESFSEKFLEQKLSRGLVSMSDLEILSFFLIREHPQAADLFSKEWDFWMVDEYQDTSPIQVALMNALIGDRPSFTVGDPQQSIYLFRGARSEVFFEKISQVKNKGGAFQEKLTNYRSNADVLHFINYYFSRLDKQFSEMQVGPDKPDFGGEHLHVLVASVSEEDKLHEEKAALFRVQELLNQGVSAEKICILSRTHRVLENVARLAGENGIDIQLHSSSGFFQRPEVRDTLSFLKFLINPHDNYNLLSLLRSPWFYIPDQQLIEWSALAKNSYWNTFEKQTAAESIQALSSYLKWSTSCGLSWTLRRALLDRKYFDYSAYIDPSGRREANIWKIVSQLSQEERRPGFNFIDFIENGLSSLSTEEGNDDGDATPVIEPKRVNLMTVHASKGLQFDHVILLSFSKNPDVRSNISWVCDEDSGQWTLPIKDLDNQKMNQSVLADIIQEKMQDRLSKEFNRVLYVALTRAISGITLITNEDYGPRSWAASCPLSFSAGKHQEQAFSYSVRSDSFKPSVIAREQINTSQLRTMWKNEDSVSSDSFSVTDLISAHATAKSTSSEDKIYSGLKRAQQGTEAHRIFESLKYHASDLLSEERTEIQEAVAYIKNLSEIPAMNLIEDGYAEWGFACKHKDRVVQGQIDLWGINQNTVWIVDYKTGSQRYADNAFSQLEIYAWALQKMNLVPEGYSLKLAVLYPMDKVVKVRYIADKSLLVSKVEAKF